jgi:hypothetical protein
MGGRDMDPIYQAKYRDKWRVATSHNYDLWSNFSLPLEDFYHL